MRQMTYVPQHSAADSASGSDGEISQRAVERTQSQPGLGRELQGAAEEVTDHIGVADDDLELVPRMRHEPTRGRPFFRIRRVPRGRSRAGVVFPRLGRRTRHFRTVEVFAKRLLDARVLLVGSFHHGRPGDSARYVMARPVSARTRESERQSRRLRHGSRSGETQGRHPGVVVSERHSPSFVEEGIGIGPGHDLTVEVFHVHAFVYDVGRLLRAGQVADAYDPQAARPEPLVDASYEPAKALSRQLGLPPPDRREQSSRILLGATGCRGSRVRGFWTDERQPRYSIK